MTANFKISKDDPLKKLIPTCAIDDWPDNFDSVSIRIASASEIKDRAKRTACKLRGTEGAVWPCPKRETCDCGEVKKAETINYRSLRPEPEGLFCEAIFGPQKDWECSCGRYKRIKHKGTVCKNCGVEVVDSRVQRGRFGYIPLAFPVAHIWFSKTFPSPIATLCELSQHQLDRILYNEAFIVLDVTDPDCPLEPRQLLSETEYTVYSDKYPGGFQADTCAGAIRKILRSIDLQTELDKLKASVLITSSDQKKRKLNKQIKQVEAFITSKQRPEAMIMDVIPVSPSALRPLIPIGFGRYATPDCNDLYRRIINRNNRIRKLIRLNTTGAILRNEHRMLQEAADSFFDNQRSPGRVTGQGNRVLKSVTQSLSGNYGTFRQERRGKSVDYSGRGVIVPDPELRPYQCGLPKSLAVKLFEPFIIRKLQDYNYAQTCKRAKFLATHVDSASPVWEVLDRVIDQHPILLSSRSTFHRIGIQAFMPILVEGEAIRVPPHVYSLFTPDSESDKVIVHVPLTVNARLEARLRMRATRNIRNPANGRSTMSPHPDIVSGLNFLTRTSPEHTADAETLHQAYIDQIFGAIQDKPWFHRRYANLHEVILAHESGKLKLHDSIQFFCTGTREPILTTVGRAIFSQILPQGLEWQDKYVNVRVPFFNDEATSEALAELLNQSFNLLDTRLTVFFFQELQKLGFKYATLSGVTGSIKDHKIPTSHQDGLGAVDYFKAATRVRNSNVNKFTAIPKATALNRQFVNVASDVLITEDDCGTRNAIWKFATENNHLAFKIRGRTTIRNIRHPITQEIIVGTGSLITPQAANVIENVNIKTVRVRSVLTCETENGICAKCYGTDLTDGVLIAPGQAIGLIAAQSIAELNMQPILTRRHIQSDNTLNITTGISRLIELFEVPKPKKDDIINPHHILKTGNITINGVLIEGEEAVWTYLIDEIQKVYPIGSLNDKHIEIIVRQMSRKIRITEPGDTQFSFNEEIEKVQFHSENQKICQNGGAPAEGKPILQGIAKAALNTESFLLTASLKQPRKVLTDAAIQGRKDPLSGIRENVMAGKLIPVGTGFKHSSD